jgi:hypothetical protein
VLCAESPPKKGGVLLYFKASNKIEIAENELAFKRGSATALSTKMGAIIDQ